MTDNASALSRRSFITAAGAAAGIAASGGFAMLPASALAAAPQAGGPLPGAIRYKVGNLEITALLDGYLDTTPDLVVGYDEEDGMRLREAAMIDGSTLRIPVNAFLVNTGERLILVDAGTADALGPTMGRLPEALAAVGVSTDQIDAILITHMHPDHLFGVIDGEGKPVFANAELFLPEVDHGFWFDDAAMNGAPEAFKPYFLGARKAAGAYAGRQTLFMGEGEILSGVRPVALPGHTPGHTGFILDSNGETLVIAGDIVHLAAYQFAKPQWGVGFDIDSAMAAQTRKAFLDRAVSENLFLAGAHIPFPGLGRVARDGDGYRFVAAAWPYAY